MCAKNSKTSFAILKYMPSYISETFNQFQYTEQTLYHITEYSCVNIGRHVHVAQVGASGCSGSVKNPVSHGMSSPCTALCAVTSTITKAARAISGLTKDCSWVLGIKVAKRGGPVPPLSHPNLPAGTPHLMVVQNN
jgi:hypothetical protein